MKTAVSIPDKVFETAERLAKRTGMSRSKIYTKALEGYLSAQDEEEIRRKLDEYYAEATNAIDPGMKKLQSRTLPKGGW